MSELTLFFKFRFEKNEFEGAKMSKKPSYRVRNWRDYNRSLVNRGSLSIWFDEASIKAWHAPAGTGQAGRPPVYTDVAIQCALTLKSVFHLPLRATEGLVASLIEMLALPIKAPNYTTLSRRQQSLEIQVVTQRSHEPLHLVTDSTGLKIFGEGEWKVRQHGFSKRRTWRKLHLAVNPRTHQIEAEALTTNDFKDNEFMEDLLEQTTQGIVQVCADGVYDAENCYQAIQDYGTKAIIPPRKNAKIKQRKSSTQPPHPRDENLRGIRQSTRNQWKQSSGYHQRSLAETAMSRFKTIFGGSLDSRTFVNQGTEALIKCRALNIITSLGMPIS